MVYRSGLESPCHNPQKTAETADNCGSSGAQEAMFTDGSAGNADANVGTPDLDARRASVRAGWVEVVRSIREANPMLQYLPLASGRGTKGGDLYFVQNGDGLIKIGSSRNVAARIHTLSKIAGRTLTVLRVQSGEWFKEGWYHRMFAEHRREGEWFSPHPDILAEIARLNLSDRP